MPGPLLKAWVNNLPRGLEELRLADNYLTGTLMQAFDFPPALLYLDFQSLHLHGTLPDCLRLPSKLRVLRLVSS